MPTCSFCKRNYENPRGLTVFTFEGRSIFYCSSKCRRNADLKRDPKKVNWVKRDKTKKKVKEVGEVKERVEKKEDKKKEKVSSTLDVGTASKDAVSHIGDKKEKVDEFLGNKIHNLRDGFYCLHGEK